MRIGLFSALVFCSQVLYGQEFFRLSGKIGNPAQDFVKLTLYTNWVSEPKEYTLKLSSNRTFLLEMPLKSIAYCDLFFGEHGLHLLKIEPGDKIDLSFDNDFFDETIEANGEGSEKWQLQFLLKQKFEIEKDWDVELSNFKNLSKDVFFSKVDKVEKQQLALLEAQRDSLSDAFVSLQHADIVGNFGMKKLGYISSHKLPASEVEVDWTIFPEFIKGKSLYLTQLADAIIDYSLDKKTFKTATEEYEYLKSYDKTFGTGITEKVLVLKLIDHINQKGATSELRLLAEDYNFYAENESFKKYLSSVLKKREILSVGQDAPNFIVTNQKGKFVELKDFRGKNIVLGFYDDDCYTCKEDISSMKVVNNFYSQRGKKDLTFVFINTSPVKDYKNYLKEESPLGVHLNGTNNAYLSNNYNLSVLPNYLIIDKNGKILSNSVEEPRLDEGRALIEQLERLIYKK